MTVPQTKEEVLKAMKVRGNQELFFFIKEVCEFGYNPDANGPRITDDQKELCNFLQAFLTLEEEAFKKWLEVNGYKSEVEAWMALILAPRDTLKSTVLQGAVLWMIIRNPNIRILLYGEVHEQAQKRLAVIKRVIQTCKTFRALYGELDGSKKGLPWNENLFVASTRTNMSIREGTVETAGIDVVVNSRHYDLIIPDDLHSEKNAQSKEQIEAIKEKVQLLMPLKTKGGRFLFAGVFWNDSDVHTWLKEEKHPALFHRSSYKENGEPNYPFALPIHELDKRKGFMREDLFSCHYLLDPISKATQRFKKEYFTITDKSKFGIIRNYLLIDPAGDPTSENANKRDSDYVGMVNWGVNAAHDAILTDGFRDKVSPTEAIEEAIHLILKHKPFIIGVERSSQGNMAFYLKEEIRKRGIFAIIVENLPKGRSKFMRVMELEPLARRRKLFVAEDCPIKDAFLEEASRFPKAKHDDLIDPSAYIIDMFKDYGNPSADEYETASKVDTDLLKLDPVSRDYWQSVRNKKNEIVQGMGEFA